MTFDKGEIILYEDDVGAVVEVHLRDETVWLSQAQMVDLFERNKRTISEHIRNVFKEGELEEQAVVRKFRTTAEDGKSYQVNYYNLDVIISVGYRVKSQRGTQFRIWATSVLKDHLVKGYTLNQKRLAEKGVAEARQTLALLARTLETQDLVTDEERAVLNIVTSYARTWNLLWQYDEDSLPGSGKKKGPGSVFSLEQVRQAIGALKKKLQVKGEATDIFGQERGDGLAGILGAIQQTFGGQELYLSLEEKAAHLLYFVIKDHPFVDGNKRIGSFLFLLFLQHGNHSPLLAPDGMVALTLLVASSQASQKDLLIRLIVNLLTS
ncbi:MAG: hypothetical protein C0613_05920 [Desulfobulbaceae bacterium]|nr:MAG: hypothetical protein C0613_05920 [Desulfobulbaceae bacterium]